MIVVCRLSEFMNDSFKMIRIPLKKLYAIKGSHIY